MKLKPANILRLFTIFGVFWLIESVTGASEPQTNVSVTKLFSSEQLVFGLIRDWNRKHPETCNVLYFKIGKQNELTEKILRKIPKKNAVTLVDPKKCGKLENREGAFIIIESDEFVAQKIADHLLPCIDELFWTSPTTKFIFLPKRTITLGEVKAIWHFFNSIKRLNVVVIFKLGGNNRESNQLMCTFNLWSGIMTFSHPSMNVDKVFSDKLENLQNYLYKIIGTYQRPRLFRKNGKVVGHGVFFVETIAKKQNAKYVITMLNMNEKRHGETWMKALRQGEADLCLNPFDFNSPYKSEFSNRYKLVNTYDVNGYCALIPIPPRPSFLFYMFDPYDWMSWMFMVISLFALAIIWRVFKAQRDSRNLNSPGHMVFLIIAGFLNQGFSFRHTRWFHLMVIQIFFFAIVILGNAYQSLVITMLMTTRNGTRIATVDEMMTKDYNYISEQWFYNMMQKFHANTSIATNLHQGLYFYDIKAFNYQEVAGNNSVLIMPCDVAHDYFYTQNQERAQGKIADFYYILPEKIYSSYTILLTSRFSPFAERFGEFSLRIFESGIKQRWKTLLHRLTDEIDLQQISIMNEDHLLKMADINFIFYIWAMGISVTLFAFVAELLCYKYREQIRQSWIGKVIRKITLEERRERKEREEAMMMRMRQRRLRTIIEEETFEMINCEV